MLHTMPSTYVSPHRGCRFIYTWIYSTSSPFGVSQVPGGDARQQKKHAAVEDAKKLYNNRALNDKEMLQ